MSHLAIYLYECEKDKPFVEVKEEDIERFSMFTKAQWNLSENTLLKILGEISRFYDFLLMQGLEVENPTRKLREFLSKQKSRKDKYTRMSNTNFITDEQIKEAKKVLPDYLKLYMMFSLSSGAKIYDIQKIRWEQINFEERNIRLEDSILYFSLEVAEMLQSEKKRREDKELNDCGYVFRSQKEENYNKPSSIAVSTIASWYGEIGKILGISNLKQSDFRHTAIKKFLSASGSVGMTAIIFNYSWLTSMAKYFTDKDRNNQLLTKYKDICEV
jgi:integrase